MNNKDRLIEYLYGEMEEEAQRRFEQELAADADLRSELEALRQTRQVLGTLPEVEPPVQIVALKPRRHLWKKWSLSAAAAAAALFLLSLLTPRLEVGDGRLVFTLGAPPPTPEAPPVSAAQDPAALERKLVYLDSVWQERLLAREEALRQEWHRQLTTAASRQRAETQHFFDQQWEEQLPGLAGLIQDLQLQQQQELRLMLTDFWDHYQQTRAADLQSIESEFANLYKTR